MGGAIVVVVAILCIAGWLIWREGGKTPLESLDSSGCGCLLALVLLIFAGLAIFGMVQGG
jgi:hypothetical protein